MKNETKEKLGIIGCVVFIILLVCTSYYLALMGDYDPGKHVCEEMGNTMFKGARITHEDYLLYIDMHHPSMYDDDTGEIVWECTEWRNKNKCEKDPNHEDCVCDERKYIYEDCTNSHLERNELCKKFISLITLEEGNPCISAHEGNECEKGNNDYIFECFGMGCLIDGSCHHPCPTNASSGGGELKKAACRIKDLGDIDCSRIKRAIHLDWRWTVIHDGSLMQGSSLRKDIYYPEDLYNEYVVRCEK